MSLPEASSRKEDSQGFFERLTPWALIPLAPAIRDARASLARAIGHLVTVPDEALELEWRLWDGDQELRYAFYRCYEVLEAATATIAAALATSQELGHALPAQPILAPATAARWDLHGVLVALADDDLDRDPGGNEWTVRETLAHTISSQRAYSWFSAWWLARRDAADYPDSVPEEVLNELPLREAEGVGTLAEVQARLDDVLDATSERLGTLGAGDLAARSRWSGHAVPISFRLARGSAHLREHTIQVDKTLAMLDRRLSEVERLVRLVAAAYGRLEERVFGLPAADLDRPGPDGTSASATLREALEMVVGHAADAAATARRTAIGT